MKLNLETNNKEQELIKAYLEENASETLTEKINNGTPFEKDGKYATDEARNLASKGANSACIEGEIVCGWAVHYFEENSIEGILYNEDGTEYKPVKTTTKTEPKPQKSLFYFMTTTEKRARKTFGKHSNR